MYHYSLIYTSRKTGKDEKVWKNRWAEKIKINYFASYTLAFHCKGFRVTCAFHQIMIKSNVNFLYCKDSLLKAGVQKLLPCVLLLEQGLGKYTQHDFLEKKSELWGKVRIPRHFWKEVHIFRTKSENETFLSEFWDFF